MSQIDTSAPEFQAALNMIRYTRQSLFLTGKAGTGKSTFLRYVRANTKKKCVVLAPTGIAAINAGGSTLHSFFKLPFHPLVPDDARYQGRRIRDFLRYSKEHIRLLQSLELIIIDEISMVRADIVDFIDRILRTFGGNSREPFGGKQMLLIGDIFQLEPVVKSDERDILARFYPSPFFFAANVFKVMEPVCIELTRVFRQKDPAFVAVLDRIRANSPTTADLALVNARVDANSTSPSPSPSAPTHLGITLCTRRDDVDHLNSSRLADLNGDAIHLMGTIKGDFPATMLPTAVDLEIKLGAQIIFVKNDQDHRWVNGTLGIVTGISASPYGLEVQTDGGDDVLVEEAQWANIRYTYNEQEHKVEEEELGTFTQFPVRLAWAITIHKSQGLTFDRATIDFGNGAFAAGQAYVALSRCRTLEGMTLKRPLARSDIFVRPEVLRFATLFNDRRAQERALQAARADIEYAAAVRAFDEQRWDDLLRHFFTAIHARYDIEKPAAQRLLRRKLSTITRLHEEKAALQAQIDDLQARLDKRSRTVLQFAKEYYLMGNECLNDFHNNTAALRNYEKAVALDPDFEAAHKRLGDCLDREGRHDEARRHWDIAASLQRRAARKRKRK